MNDATLLMVWGDDDFKPLVYVIKDGQGLQVDLPLERRMSRLIVERRSEADCEKVRKEATGQ